MSDYMKEMERLVSDLIDAAHGTVMTEDQEREDTARAALLAHAAQADRDALRWTWQPIETAPTDGTRILLRGKDGKIADGHYGQPDGYANPKQFVWPYINANPTHWRPLPAQHESAAPVELPEPNIRKLLFACEAPDAAFHTQWKDGIDIDVPAHWVEKFCAEYGDAREAAGYAAGVAAERERCADMAWLHYMSTCRAKNINAGEFYDWCCASALRGEVKP